MPIGYNPDVINPGGIDYAEMDSLVNPPNPANAGKAIVIDESGKPTLGEVGGSGGITIIEPTITETGLDLGYSYNDVINMGFCVVKLSEDPGRYLLAFLHRYGVAEGKYYCGFDDGGGDLAFEATDADENLQYTES